MHVNDLDQQELKARVYPQITHHIQSDVGCATVPLFLQKMEKCIGYNYIDEGSVGLTRKNMSKQRNMNT